MTRARTRIGGGGGGPLRADSVFHDLGRLWIEDSYLTSSMVVTPQTEHVYDA